MRSLVMGMYIAVDTSTVNLKAMVNIYGRTEAPSKAYSKMD